MAVLDQKPSFRAVLDQKSTDLMIRDIKPRINKISQETKIYFARIIGAGEWMGSPFLTYPNELIIARP